MLYVIFAALLVMALLVARRVRQVASAATASTAHQILDALYSSIKPLNVTEIMQLVPRNSGLIINAIKLLHSQEMIQSTQPVTNIKAATDTGRYSLTRLGKDEVRRRRQSRSTS